MILGIAKFLFALWVLWNVSFAFYACVVLTVTGDVRLIVEYGYSITDYLKFIGLNMIDIGIAEFFIIIFALPMITITVAYILIAITVVKIMKR